MPSSSDNKWNPIPDLTLAQRAGIGAIFCAIVLLPLAVSSGSLIEDYLAHPIEFIARRALGRAPKLDPRIKILVMPKKQFTGGDWAKIFNRLAERKPKAVLVEHVFGIHYPTLDAEEVRAAISKIEVVAGASNVSDFIETDHHMNLSRPDYDLRAMLGKRPLTEEAVIMELGWLHRRAAQFFGPDEEVADAFRHIGHVAIEGAGIARYIRPVLRADRFWAIPYFALFSADDLKLRPAGAVINGKLARFDLENRLPVNFSDRTEYLARAKPIRELTRNPEGIDIKPGDYVVILPHQGIPFRDGEAELHGFFAPQEQSFVPVAVLNSVLTGHWLWPGRGKFLFSFLATIAGSTLALAVPGGWLFFGAVLAGAIAIAAAGVLCFSFLGMIVPWFFPCVGFTVAALLVALFRRAARKVMARRLRRLLSGTIPESQIEIILENPEKLSLTAAEKILTIMFIDVVGFSRSAEKRQPREVFAELRDLLNELTTTVHAFGGVVDRTLGDGMLCVFGYDYGIAEQQDKHADQAVACAARIQRDQVQRALQADLTGKPVYPLRIGINTTALFVGDLGGENRIDITVIGDGVNFAQRLEAACESYRVMLGPSTKAALSVMSLGEVRRKLLAIKHHREAMEAFELDPFSDDPLALDGALRVYRKLEPAERDDDRWEVPGEIDLPIATEFGMGSLVNFSRNGFALKLDKYLSRGMALHLNFLTPPPELHAELAKWGLSKLVVDVRWGRPAPGGRFLHGVKIRNLDERQLEALMNCLNALRARPPLRQAS